MRQVYEFVGLSELYYAGSHGMDIMSPAGESLNHKHLSRTVSINEQVFIFFPFFCFSVISVYTIRFLIYVTLENFRGKMLICSRLLASFYQWLIRYSQIHLLMCSWVINIIFDSWDFILSGVLFACGEYKGYQRSQSRRQQVLHLCALPQCRRKGFCFSQF